MTTPVIRMIDDLLAYETPAMKWLREAGKKLDAMKAEEHQREPVHANNVPGRDQ